MIKMANSFSFRNFLRERRVDWENNLPLNDVIIQIETDGYLSTYQYEELIAISNYNERRRKFVNLFLEKDARAVEYLFDLVRGLKGYSHLLPSSVQQDCEISKLSTKLEGQCTSIALTDLTQLPDWKKLFEAFESELIDFPESYDIRKAHQNIMIQLSYVLKKITEEELQAARSSLLDGCKWQLGIEIPSDIPDSTTGLENYLQIWTTPLDVRMVEYVEEAIKDKKKTKELVVALETHKDQLKTFSEETLTYFKEHGVKLKKDVNLSHIVVEVSLKPEEYLLRELLRLKTYLQKCLLINPLLFKGFIGNSILLIFQISTKVASLLAPIIFSHQSILRNDYSVTKILVQDQFAVDVQEGKYYSLVQASIQALQEKHKSDMKNLEGLHHSTMMEFQSLEVKLASSKETVKHLKRKLEERERELLREKQEVKRLKEEKLREKEFQKSPRMEKAEKQEKQSIAKKISNQSENEKRLRSLIENYGIFLAKKKGFGDCTVEEDDIKTVNRNVYPVVINGQNKLKITPGVVIRCHPGSPIAKGVAIGGVGGATGVVGGATTGAIIGSVVPGIGTAIGGVVGGVVGLLTEGVTGGTVGAGVSVSEKDDRTFTVSLKDVLEYHYSNGEIPEFICRSKEIIIKAFYN